MPRAIEVVGWHALDFDADAGDPQPLHHRVGQELLLHEGANDHPAEVDDAALRVRVKEKVEENLVSALFDQHRAVAFRCKENPLSSD